MWQISGCQVQGTCRFSLPKTPHSYMLASNQNLWLYCFSYFCSSFVSVQCYTYLKQVSIEGECFWNVVQNVYWAPSKQPNEMFSLEIQLFSCCVRRPISFKLHSEKFIVAEILRSSIALRMEAWLEHNHLKFKITQRSSKFSIFTLTII